MTVRTSRGLVDDYLAELRGAARGLPRARRRELIGQIEEHLSEAIQPGAGEAVTRTELDRLGPPAEIIAEEQQRLGPSRAAGGTFEWVTVALLLVGGFVIPILGWVVGVAMLWSSRVWTGREKLIGTLLVPGGLGGAFFWVLVLGSSSRSCGAVGASIHCTPGPSTLTSALRAAVVVFLIVVPILTAIYLGRRARRPVDALGA